MQINREEKQLWKHNQRPDGNKRTHKMIVWRGDDRRRPPIKTFFFFFENLLNNIWIWFTHGFTSKMDMRKTQSFVLMFWFLIVAIVKHEWSHVICDAPHTENENVKHTRPTIITWNKKSTKRKRKKTTTTKFTPFYSHGVFSLFSSPLSALRLCANLKRNRKFWHRII